MRDVEGKAAREAATERASEGVSIMKNEVKAKARSRQGWLSSFSLDGKHRAKQ
jgi:hypothetical protein